MKQLLLLLFFSSLLSAQENRNNIFSLKPSAGINGCQIHGDSYAGYEKLGLFAGLAVNAKTGNENVTLEMGFYFSQKGSRHIPNSADPSYYRLHLNYIDIPLIINYVVKSGYFVTLGPSLGYLINHNENRNYTNETSFYRYNKYEGGINIGIGKHFTDNFSVEVRSSNSVTPIRSIVANIYYPNPVARYFNRGYYNNLLSFMATYKLDNKKRNAS
jgi:hypothetical protein